MTELAELIRRRRLELRLTQREAAENAGLSLATWQNLERPASNPDGFQELTLARAAHGLRIGLPQIFDAAGRPLPEHDPTGNPGQATGQDPPPTDAAAEPDELIGQLTDKLHQLAQLSQSSFHIVYSQALETAEHLLEIHTHRSAKHNPNVDAPRP